MGFRVWGCGGEGLGVNSGFAECTVRLNTRALR